MFWSNYVTITRRGYDITIPKSILKECNQNNYSISLVKRNNKPATVQIVYQEYDPKIKRARSVYMGTLKKHLGVAKFKDGNPCNFKKSNLIFE